MNSVSRFRTHLLLVSALFALVTTTARAQDTIAPPQADVAPPPAVGTAYDPPAPTRETNCGDHLDDDRDGLTDCADADCFDAPACEAGGSEENTEAACRDWLDNDGDGSVDCDDQDCQRPEITSCHGSWSGGGSLSSGLALTPPSQDLPELAEGQSLEDLIGTGNDRDGERSDESCSDGIDNDLDGATDCADIGCRVDPSVTVCTSHAGIRFSVVGGGGARVTLNYTADGAYTGNVPEGGITLIQLRAMGQMPGIQNSFFLLSARLEDSFRLSFVLFQVPISSRGHYLQVNSGSGTLSTIRIISAARQLFLDPANYMAAAFEQGNGVVLETGGPIDDDGRVRFRLFGAVGSNQFSSSVGGRFFSADDRNFAWTAGGQLQFDIFGHYDRIGDNPYVYTPNPLTLAVLVGAKFDTLPNEQDVAWHALAMFRFWHFEVRAESYSRYVLDYGAVQTAYNFSVAALLVPRTLLLAGDIGGFYHPVGYSGLPSGSTSMTPRGVTYQPELLQYRIALHWFFFRNVGVATLLYQEVQREHVPTALLADTERILRVEARFRF